MTAAERVFAAPEVGEREQTTLPDRGDEDTDYAQYIQGVVLENMLEGELQCLHDNCSAAELQGVADNLLSEYTDNALQSMNVEIIDFVDDIERTKTLEMNLERIVTQIQTLPWVTALYRTSLRLSFHKIIAIIPLEYGVLDRELLPTVESGIRKVEDLGVNIHSDESRDAIQSLEAAFNLLQSSGSKFTVECTDVREMNRVLLRAMSIILSRKSKDKMANRKFR